MEPVVVVQPVHQHAYETAVGAQEAGMLRAYVTGIYATGRGLTRRSVVTRLPRAVRDQLRRRVHAELDPGRVITIGRYHALSYLLRPLSRSLRLDAERWAHERFDRAVARRLRRREGVAIVHAFEGTALEVFRSARRLGVTKVLDVPAAHERYREVEAEEGGDASRYPTDRVRAERELADRLFVPSRFVEDCLLENGVPAKRIVRIPYGVDPERFAPTQGSGGFRVLFVGQIGLRKGVRYLLEAWRTLDLRGAELVLVGAADDYGKKLLRRYEGLYEWVGPVPRYEVERWFGVSDVFAFPTLAEGSAIVSYEAMASALPIVTTLNCGSVARDGVDGFIVSPRDVDGIAERLAALHADPARAREMGLRARELILERYTWSHYRARVAHEYTRLMGERGGNGIPAA